MNKELVFLELGVVLVIEGNNPTILNPDFLRHSCAVPSSWELAGSPLCADELSQVTFKNGLIIQGLPDRFLFVERLISRSWESAEAPGLARQLVSALPKLKYTAIGINPKAFVSLASDVDARELLTRQLKCSASWLNYKDTLPTIHGKLTYPNVHGFFQIAVDPGQVNISGQAPVPAVIFGSNIHRNINSYDEADCAATVINRIDGWKSDIEEFQDFIINHVLSGV